jgi:hypothetical protein
MKQSNWKWLLIASLSLNLGCVGAVLYLQMRPAASSQASTTARVNLPDYLQLSPQQRQQWAQLEPGFLHDIAGNWEQIRRHREALVQHIFTPSPVLSFINAEQARIAALQDAQQQRVISQLLAEREMLDSGQRAKLMQLLLTRYAQEATEEERLHRD